MGGERHVLWKRPEVVALREHACRDQRWREQGLSAPGLTKRLKGAIEVAEQSQRHSVESGLPEPEKVDSRQFVVAHAVELCRIEIAEYDLPFETSQACLYAFGERFDLRSQRIRVFGRHVAFQGVAGTGECWISQIHR